MAGLLGERLKSKRLNKNLTQQEQGTLSNTSRSIVKNAENGSTSLINLIAILSALQELEQLDNFLFEPDVSPMQLLKLKGKKRQRAAGKNNQTPAEQNNENRRNQQRTK